MIDSELLEIPADSELNIEGIRNVPVCPMCTAELGPVAAGYTYKRNNPDTRWFFCTECACHLGYHRMKKRWKVDPYDLNDNAKVREYFGLEPTETA